MGKIKEILCNLSENDQNLFLSLVDHYDNQDTREILIDVLADLRGIAHDLDLDFADCDRIAAKHYGVETKPTDLAPVAPVVQEIEEDTDPATIRCWQIFAIPCDVEATDEFEAEEKVGETDAPWSDAEYIGSLISGKEEGLQLTVTDADELFFEYL